MCRSDQRCIKRRAMAAHLWDIAPPGSQSCRPAIGFCSFDLIVYYLPANSFIFNLFLWPAAKDSDTVIFFFFTRARHTSPWIIWSYSWARCYHSWTRACSARLTQARRRHSQSSCFFTLFYILQPFYSGHFWICRDRLGPWEWCKWDQGRAVVVIGGNAERRGSVCSKKHDRTLFPPFTRDMLIFNRFDQCSVKCAVYCGTTSYSSATQTIDIVVNCKESVKALCYPHASHALSTIF